MNDGAFIVVWLKVKGPVLEDQLGQWRKLLDWENSSPKDRPELRRPREVKRGTGLEPRQS